MKTLSMLSTFILIISSISCSKQDSTNTQVIPTPQYIELKISYSGTAFNWDTHKLYYIVNYNNYTPPYDPFSFQITNGVINGAEFKSPYKFEPGDYEIRGFYDFNNSDTWEEYEPIVVPQNITVNGISQQQFNFTLQDKTTPDQQGWIEGAISYSGSGQGDHYVFAEIVYEGQYLGEFKITYSPVHFSSGSILYSTNFLSKGTYMLTYFWDLDDDGHLNHANEPNITLSSIIVCPGLPTVKNIQLQ
jgi:hypothetical protein